MMYRFSVGDVLTRSFAILARNFLPFYLLIAVIQLPVLALSVYFAVISRDVAGNAQRLLGDDSNEMFLHFAGIGGLVLIAAMLLGPLSTASVTYGVLQQLRGKHASIGDCIRVGVSRMFSVLGVALVAGLLIGIGTMACCIPGIFLATAYYVATPAAVVERLGVGGAMTRSWNLTEGLRWHVFGLVVCLGVIGGMVQGAFSVPTQNIEEQSLTGTIVVAVLSSLAGVAVDALKAVAAAVAYHDLRTEREGVTSHDLARVFD